jgi:uncharacterized protein (DUF983 family)
LETVKKKKKLDKPRCPECGSGHTYYRKKTKGHTCVTCGAEF